MNGGLSPRILGYTFLHPSVCPPARAVSGLEPAGRVPHPGCKGLWDSLSVEEAAGARRSVPDAPAAAKKLCTLAQSHVAARVSAVVVQPALPRQLLLLSGCLAAAQPQRPRPPQAWLSGSAGRRAGRASSSSG